MIQELPRLSLCWFIPFSALAFPTDFARMCSSYRDIYCVNSTNVTLMMASQSSTHHLSQHTRGIERHMEQERQCQTRTVTAQRPSQLSHTSSNLTTLSLSQMSLWMLIRLMFQQIGNNVYRTNSSSVADFVASRTI